MQFLRKLRREAARRNKSQFPAFDKLTALLDVEESHLRQPYVDMAGNYQDRGVKAGFVVTAPKELRERFPCFLYPPRMEMNKCGRAVRTCSGHHSEDVGTTNEGTVQHNTRKVPL
jgi:hypothetical protein